MASKSRQDNIEHEQFDKMDALMVSKMAVMETKTEILEIQLDKLEKLVYEIKDNHLAHLAMAVNNIQLTLDQVKNSTEKVKDLETKLLKQDLNMQAVKDVRKMLIAVAVILLPYGLYMSVEILQKVGVIH